MIALNDYGDPLRRNTVSSDRGASQEANETSL